MIDTPSLVEQDKLHWVHPVVSLRQHESKGARIWASAEGIHLIDTDGRRVQDAFSGLWCVNAGYGQQSLIEAATRQLQKLPYGTGYFHFANEPAVRLASRLAELAPEGLTRVGEVRGRGLLAAVELVDDKESQRKPRKSKRLGERVLEHALEEGLVFRAFSDDILGFAPALN